MKLECGLQKLAPVGEGILRILYTEKEGFSLDEKPGILGQKPFPEWTYEVSEHLVTLRMKGLTTKIDRETNQFRYYDEQGKLLLADRAERSKELEEYPIFRMDDKTAEKEFVDTPDGRKEIIRSAAKIQIGTAYHARMHLCFDDEALYGLGQHEEGYGSLRGKRVYLHQANRRIAIPLLTSTKGYGILWNTYAPAIFNDTEEGTYLYSEADPEMDFFFINGAVLAGRDRAMEGVIRGYRMLTGKATLLPKWAYGYVQSQERYETQEEILSVVQEYRKRGIGLDCIVLDWCSWPEGQWGQKSFDTDRFPDALAMTEKLHEEHVHFMISIWPNLTEGTENYEEFREKGLLLLGINNYNPLLSEGRKTYWKQTERGLFRHGVDAWWCDNSEPFTPEWNHLVRPENSKSQEEYQDVASKHLPATMTNAYGFYHAQAIYEGQRGYYANLKAAGLSEGREQTGLAELGKGAVKEKRVVNLTRSGYLGQQRFGTILWSGDISASWETLRRQIAAGLHFCASGLPYWTVDVGAFFVKKGLQWFWDGKYDGGAKDPAYCELFTRWFQWGAFLPVFRVHGTDFRRELWEFDHPEAPFYQALINANRLRYELMPYVYSLAGRTWAFDETIIKPLAYGFAEDREVWGIMDQYLFGDAMMICPVTEPFYFGSDGKRNAGDRCVRKVYLPKGCGWFDYWSEAYYEGGQWILTDAPLERIPVFVRSGSILPKKAFAQSVEEQGEDVTLTVYSGRDASFSLYEDAGDGYDYENGEWEMTEFTWKEDLQKLLVKGKKELSKIPLRIVRPF
ncbi:MAG: DUF5110 domain-containing protein [Acetatifactor sp.]|nr:DUF5110 domain-containing protein [Acetatifactor sp.]